jgi:hypothetical protein
LEKEKSSRKGTEKGRACVVQARPFSGVQKKFYGGEKIFGKKFLSTANGECQVPNGETYLRILYLKYTHIRTFENSLL